MTPSTLSLLALTALPALAQAMPAAPAQQDAERGLIQNSEGAFDGYTLFTPLRSGETYLVDMSGEVVHSWTSSYAPGNHVQVLDNGNLLRLGRTVHETMNGGGQGGRIQEFTWDGELVWDFAASSDDRHAHHDYELLPNGNILVIAWEYKTPKQALAYGRDPEQVGDDGFWPDVIYEMTPVRPDGGEIVWEWHAWDHLIQDREPARPNYGSVVDRAELIDINGDHRDDRPLSAEEQARKAKELDQMKAIGYVGESGAGESGSADFMHTNAVDYHPEHDLILISVRRFNEFWVIDHSTTSEEARGSTGGRYGKGGDLLYRWGNPRTYGLGNDETQMLFGQHDAQWIEPGLPGAGDILIFNNGSGRGYSSIEQVTTPFSAKTGFYRDEEQPFEPHAAHWSYRADPPESFFSSFISGTQRLPNGNTLICSGTDGRIFEVTPEGATVWEFRNPFSGDLGLQAGSPRGGPPARDGGPPPGGGPGAGPPRGLAHHGLFRATRIARDDPRLSRLERE